MSSCFYQLIYHIETKSSVYLYKALAISAFYGPIQGLFLVFKIYYVISFQRKAMEEHINIWWNI